jgi:hypothetical protein
LQKHRDIIKDYTDVPPDEKEYISEWDAFSISRKANLGPQLQEIYLEFLEEKAAWLSASQNRLNEAMKHLTYLMARDVLTEETIQKALEFTKQLKAQAREGRRDRVDASTTNLTHKQGVSHATGCVVCGQPSAGPSQIICSNLVC